MLGQALESFVVLLVIIRQHPIINSGGRDIDAASSSLFVESRTLYHETINSVASPYVDKYGRNIK
jgi:hypothetical protein